MPAGAAEEDRILNPDFARRVNLFTELHATMEGKEVAYRLFVPRGLQKPGTGKVPAAASAGRERYPLLVWLHGAGEAGSENWKQLAYIKEAVEEWQREKGEFKCFILAPQCPKSEAGWSDTMTAMAGALMEKACREWPIDTDRIYAAGVSAGGSAVWRLCAAKPSTFAALAPIACAGAGDVPAQTFVSVPIWAFHVSGDQLIKIDMVRKTISNVEDAGGACWLTETPGDRHNCWTAALDEYHVLDWLLQQQRGKPAVVPTKYPDSRGLLGLDLRYVVAYWPIGVWIVVIGAVVLAVRRQFR